MSDANFFLYKLAELLSSDRKTEFEARIRNSMSCEDYGSLCNTLVAFKDGRPLPGPAETLILTFRAFEAILYEPTGNPPENGGALSQARLDDLCRSIEPYFQEQWGKAMPPPAPPVYQEQVRGLMTGGQKRTHDAMVAGTPEPDGTSRPNGRSSRRRKAADPVVFAAPSADIELPNLEKWVSGKNRETQEQYQSVYKSSSPSLSPIPSTSFATPGTGFSTFAQGTPLQPTFAHNAFPGPASTLYNSYGAYS